MKEIRGDVLEAMEKSHPFEAAIWEGRVAAGTATLVEKTTEEALKCKKSA